MNENDRSAQIFQYRFIFHYPTITDHLQRLLIKNCEVHILYEKLR